MYVPEPHLVKINKSEARAHFLYLKLGSIIVLEMLAVISNTRSKNIHKLLKQQETVVTPPRNPKFFEFILILGLTNSSKG